ncbi:TPA: EpsG family protein [Vibrio alginolyticus]|uniref:EpsG family protein n=1 Tax=Vibrio alginolyticus TaxID=663 RepID=UPI001BD5C6B2|nr:EpsG family protein [Vibrio alginolyticus]MBS9881886.1 EpsG family protein [Vibrio alginolyticus]MCR9896953.1 EpsG family protein [Vibrio alginolyticus]
MTVYIIICSFLAFFCFVEVFFNKQLRDIRALFYLYFVIFLILFSGLRSLGVGTDDFTYYDKFLEVPSIIHWIDGDFTYSFAKVWMEPAYIFIGAISKSISLHPTALFLPVAFLSITIASYYYKKISPYYFMSMMLFFSHTYLYRDINQMRSAIACAIGLGIVWAIYHRKKLASVVLIVVSTCFHMVGLTYLVALTFEKISHIRKLHLYCLILAIVISLSGFVSIIIGNITFLGVISTKIAGYTSTDRFVNSVGLFDVTNIKNILVFLCCYYFWNSLSNRYELFRVCFTFFTFGMLWRIAFSELGVLAARVATVFTITEVILIPMLVGIFKQKIIPTIIVVIYAFLMLYINLFLKDGRNPYSMSIGIL